MESSREYYRRNLPHYQPSDYAFFVTFRLHGTLPLEVVNHFKDIKNKKLALIAEYKNINVRKEKYEEFKFEYFKLFDDYMDKCNAGNKWLREDKAAEIVKEAIHYRDGSEYYLISYTIMPNHVHMVFIPIEKQYNESADKEMTEKEFGLINGGEITGRSKMRSEIAFRSTGEEAQKYVVTKILQQLKRNSAKRCNRVLHRSGTFWQHESYDHVIRNSDELKRIVDYIMNNPVKAYLAEIPEEWPYSYVNSDFIPVL